MQFSNVLTVFVTLLLLIDAGPANAQDVLKIAVSKLTKTMDPIHNWHYLDDEIIEPTLQTLVRINKKGSIVGDLAKRWEIKEDGLLYIFTLKKSLFNDGSSVTADDVVFSLLRQKNSETTGIEGKLLTELLSNKSSIYAKGNKVHIKLKNPYPPLIKLLSRPMYGVIKKQTIISVPPITSGIFFAKYEKNGQILVLNRKEKSVNYINRIIIQEMSRESAFDAIKDGSIDIILGHTYSAKEAKALPSKFSRSKLESLGTLHLYTNMSGVLKHDNLRKSICLNLKQVAASADIDKLYLTYSDKYLPQGIMLSSYYNEKNIIKNEDKIIKKSSSKIRIILRKEYLSKDYVKKVEISLSKFFNEVEIKEMYIKDIIPILKTGKYDLALIGYYGFLPDPDGFLGPLQTKTKIQIGNFPKQKNGFLTSINRIRTNKNKIDRLIKYKHIFSNFESECYVIPQFYVSFPIVINDNLSIDRIKYQYTTLMENIKWKK